MNNECNKALEIPRNNQVATKEQPSNSQGTTKQQPINNKARTTLQAVSYMMLLYDLF